MFDFIKNFWFNYIFCLEHWTIVNSSHNKTRIWYLQILLNWKQNVHWNTDIFPLSFVIQWYSYCPIYFPNWTFDPAVFSYIFFCPFFLVLCSAPHILSELNGGPDSSRLPLLEALHSPKHSSVLDISSFVYSLPFLLSELDGGPNCSWLPVLEALRPPKHSSAPHLNPLQLFRPADGRPH